MEQNKILIVDDDDEIRDLIGTLLAGEGYAVTQAARGEEALNLADSDLALIILDVMMSGLSGYQVCAKLREKINVPVLFLTAKAMDSDLTMGYSVGGDDYLTKPFSFAELLARVKGLIRRYTVYSGRTAEVSEGYLTYGELRVNAEFNETFLNGEEINLTEIEYQILLLMLKNKGRIFTMQNLYESVWNEPYYSTSANTIMAHIRKLRVKIESDPQNPKIVKTVWGKGYRIDKI